MGAALFSVVHSFPTVIKGIRQGTGFLYFYIYINMFEAFYQ